MTAATGCSGGSLGSAAAANAMLLSPAPCGGSVSAAGTTPAGAFEGTLVSALYDGCGDAVEVLIGDASRGLVFTVSAPYHRTNDTIVPGDLAAMGELDRRQPPAVVARPVGTLTVIAADFLPIDAPLAGQIQGTFQFTQDGFALSGTFSSPYCRHLTLCGD